MKIHYNKNTGEILGYYEDKDAHIPEPNVSVSDNQYNKALSNNDTHIDYKTLSTYKKPPEITLEYISAIILGEVDLALNNKAREYGFDNLISALTYIAIPNKFQEISKALFDWRDKCYSYLEGLRQDVLDGKIDVKTASIESILNNLPKFEAPKD